MTDLFEMEPLTPEEADLVARYHAAAHGMQSGVAVEMNHNARPTEPKHLRVGINARAVDHAALAHLLIKKGVITRTEYLQALCDHMEAEKRQYEERVQQLTGHHITLG